MDYTGKSVRANYYREGMVFGGKLLFDETGVTFRPNKAPISAAACRIEYRDIGEVSTVNEMGYIPTGLIVTTADGGEHRFVVYHRTRIMGWLLLQKEKGRE